MHLMRQPDWRSSMRGVLAVTDGVDAPPDGIAMCQVGGVVNAKRGRGRPWNRFT